jgi:hypothetical protein
VIGITRLRSFFACDPLVARSRKLDMGKIRAAFNMTWPQCKTSIPPNRLRIVFEHLKCPKCEPALYAKNKKVLTVNFCQGILDIHKPLTVRGLSSRDTFLFGSFFL